MAKFIGTTEEIGRYLGDFLDGLVDGRVEELTRSYGNICVACGRRETALETVPAKGYGREQTLRSVLERGKYFCVDGEYLVGLNDLIDDYWDSLEPAEDNFFFLCPECRRKYEKGELSDEKIILGRLEQCRRLLAAAGTGQKLSSGISKAVLYKREEESVQEYVQRLFFTLYREGLLTPELLGNLQNRRYCEENFGIRYPLLERDESKIRPAGYARYYVTFRLGGEYYLCSQWWKENFPEYTRLLHRWVDGLKI